MRAVLDRDVAGQDRGVGVASSAAAIFRLRLMGRSSQRADRVIRPVE